MKKWQRIAGLVGLFWSLLSIMGMATLYQQNKICERVNIMIETQMQEYYVSERELRRVIGLEQYMQEVSVKDIYLNEIEKRLQQLKFLKKATAFYNRNGDVNIKIKLRSPLARVVNQRKSLSFYIDADAVFIPAKESFRTRAPLIMGSFQQPLGEVIEDSTLLALIPFLQYIQADSLWRAQIAEIYVTPQREITLCTAVGNTKIIFGRPERYEEKLERLYHFYKKVLKKVGWEYYAIINVRYSNQIVATPRNNKV
jgi:cell division protein FtsQ